MEGGSSTNTFGRSKILKLVVMHQIDHWRLSELFDEPLPPAAVYGDQHPPSRITRERFQNVFQNLQLNVLDVFNEFPFEFNYKESIGIQEYLKLSEINMVKVKQVYINFLINSTFINGNSS